MIQNTDDYTVTQLEQGKSIVVTKDSTIIPEVVKAISDDDKSSYIVTDTSFDNCLIHCAGKTKHFVLAKSIIPAVVETDEYITDKLTRMNISTIRKANHLTQKELAEVSGLSAQCIGNIESMDSIQSPTLRSLIKYTNALGYEILFTKIKEN